MGGVVHNVIHAKNVLGPLFSISLEAPHKNGKLSALPPLSLGINPGIWDCKWCWGCGWGCGCLAGFLTNCPTHDARHNFQLTVAIGR